MVRLLFHNLVPVYQRLIQFIPEHEPGMWNALTANFLKHTEQINSDLKAAGLPTLIVAQ